MVSPDTDLIDPQIDFKAHEHCSLNNGEVGHKVTNILPKTSVTAMIGKLDFK